MTALRQRFLIALHALVLLVAQLIVAGDAAAQAPAIEYRVVKGSVGAFAGGQELWTHTLDPFGRLKISGPLPVGAWVYFAAGTSVYEVDPQSGIVKRRLSLPAVVTHLAAAGDTVIAKVDIGYAGNEVPREYRLTAGAWPPFFLSGSLMAARGTRALAESIGKLQKPSAAQLAAAVAELEKRARLDPTNPWFHYWRGVCLQQLQRKDEALSAFSAVLAVDPAYDYELLALAQKLDTVSAEWGQKAFDRGLRFLLTHGFEPELNTGLIAVLVYYGSSDYLAQVHDLDVLNRMGERIWDLAPRCEGAASMFQGLANANHRAGRGEAALWAERAQAALPYRMWGGAFVSWTGPALSLLFAALLTLAACFVVKCLYHLPQRRLATGGARFNPFTAWTRGEILGFLLVLATLVFATAQVIRGVTAIGRIVALPIAVVSGSLGHPSGEAYFSERQGTPGGDFLFALSLQQAGQLDRAAEIYLRLDSARALNNLGVLRQAQQKSDEAKRLYAEALAKDPQLGEAAFNLGREARSQRVDRARKYGLTSPLLAMPADAMWTEAMTAGALTEASPWQLFSMFGLVQKLSSADTVVVHRAALLNGNMVLLLMVLLVAYLAVRAMAHRTTDAPAARPGPISYLGWLLSFLLPGTSRRLSVCGPPLMMLACFSFFVWHALGASQGAATNLLDAIAIPSLTRAYGIVGKIDPPHEIVIRQMAHFWWIAWILNLLLLALLELKHPDPLGPRSARSQG
ncbi:MAG: hypothetical protein MUF51_05205 [Vicinamibacteria bacterium]|jgi:tetratricopeptide (TPR) repeat protein|nr:hypothetical protein [Vicinamibacteria bacterium]